MLPCSCIPGPVPGARAAAALGDPLWWPALTGYVQSMQASWLAFLARGRAAHPRLRVAFAMLAGLAPLHGERLASRGGPVEHIVNPLVFLRHLLVRSGGDSSGRRGRRPRAASVRLGPPGGRARPLDLAAGPDALGFELASVAAQAAMRLFGSGARSPGTAPTRSAGRLDLPAHAAASQLDARRVVAHADSATEPILR